MGTRVKQNYRFALIRKAARAMAVANKVSIRGDIQGVLSLQFMIELGGDNSSGGAGSISGGASGVSSGATSFGGVTVPSVSGGFGNVSFVDFRFVPLIDEEEGEGGDEGHETENVEIDL
jgi:cell cycle checkpoint protein